MPLEGGQGRSWATGNLVLKPLDMSEEELTWQAEVLPGIMEDGFRVSSPVRAGDGRLIVEGWSCWQRLEGSHEPGRWADIVRAGERFHAALRDVPEPSFISARTDPWAIGDRIAWGEIRTGSLPNVKHLPRLIDALRPVYAPRQVIHGDLTGNVLFARGLAPGIIDLAAYYRPAAFASAVVICDAFVFEGADGSVLDTVSHVEDFPQYLLRAVIYRAVTDRLFRLGEPIRDDGSDPYLPVVDLACRLAMG
jgi:uncharacterized protein (TIGR02569 family)